MPGYSGIEALWQCEDNCYHFTVFKRDFIVGRGLRSCCKGKLGGAKRGKKPMRIIKCCMINEHLLESFSLCLELTLQQVSGFCRMKTDSIVLSTSLQTPALHAPLPKRYCVKLNCMLNFHSFLPPPPSFDTVTEFFLKCCEINLLGNSDIYIH